MSEFLREVDEDYRRDQLVKLWRQFGPWVIGAAILTVVAVGATKYWDSHVASIRQENAQLYGDAISAAEASRTAEAHAIFNELQTGKAEGYAILARLNQARLEMTAGDVQAAVSAYDAIAGDENAPKELRDLATLLSTTAQLETLSSDAVQERLTLIAQPEQPWAALANEAMGMAFLRESRMDQAREIFSLLSIDPTIPQGVKARASNIMTLLGPALVQDTSETDEATGIMTNDTQPMNEPEEGTNQ